MSKLQGVGIPPDKAACNILVEKCSIAGATSAITHVLHRLVFLVALEAFKNSGESDHLLREVNPHLIFEGIEEEIDFDPASSYILYVIDRDLIINHLVKKNFVAIEHVLNEEMVKTGIDLGTYLVSLLIHQLGCAGLSSVAAKIFLSFPTDHIVVTYTLLMSAYFKSHEVDKGLEIYSRMRSQGILVSYGTYEVLIVGLEGAGRISDAEKYRKERRSLQWRNYFPESLSAEESLYNCLFGGT